VSADDTQRMPTRAHRCPLCGSAVSNQQYLKIVGVWQERHRLEQSLKDRLGQLQAEKARWREKERKLTQRVRQAARNAAAKATAKERRRADRLAAMIDGKSQQIQTLSRKVKDLQEQLKRGTTPQVEGLNYERELVRDLKSNFPHDRIEHHGQSGDILHCVMHKGKPIGTVLVECKLTSKFSRAYVVQTKRAVADRNATHGVLVTLAPKRGTAGFWVDSDILIVHPFGAVHVLGVLRQHILSLHATKIGRRESDRRATALMTYIKSDEFKNLVGDTIFRTHELYEMLKKELLNHRAVWKRRFDHYRQIHGHSVRLKAQTGAILQGDRASRIDLHSQPKLLPPATL
jgi:hypothetical protein